MSAKSKAQEGLGVFVHDDKVCFYYQRPVLGSNQFCLAEGENAFEFSLQSDTISFSADTAKTRKKAVVPSGRLQISKYEDRLRMVFQGAGAEKKSQLYFADSKDLVTWTDVRAIAPGIPGPGIMIPKDSARHHLLFFGSETIRMAVSRDSEDWTLREYSVLEPRSGFFDSGPLEIANAWMVEQGLLMLYHSKKKEGVSCHNRIEKPQVDNTYNMG